MRLLDNEIAHFFELETSLHQKQIRNSVSAVSALLADDFIEFGSSGRVWDKASIVEGLRGEKLDQQITVGDFVAQELAPNVVLVTYVSKQRREGSEDQGTISSLRSSIWKRFDGKWQMVFHQGTRISVLPP